MRDPSNYIKYLPSLLWETAPSAQTLSLGQMLLVFEKILTGIQDDVIVTKDEKEKRVYAPLQDVIAQNFRNYSPWTAPASPSGPIDQQTSALDFLAQWVALQFAPDWLEYERRKVLSQIVQIYSARGTADGLNKLLEVYATFSQSPRVVIDDGSKVLFTRPTAGTIAPIYTLVSQLPLISPVCLTQGPDGTMFVGDLGNIATDHPELHVTPQPAGVWAVSRSGQYLSFPDPPTAANPSPIVGPRPIGAPPQDVTWTPQAVAADKADPFGLYVLAEVAGTPGLYRLSSQHLYVTKDELKPIVTNNQLKNPQPPVAMIVSASGDVLILDQGSASGQSRILQVQLQGNPPVFRATQEHPLPDIADPLSMVELHDRTLVVGDVGPLTSKTAVLWSVDPAHASATPILIDAAQNPLVAPTAIVEEDSNCLLVLDAGLKPLRPSVAHFEPLVAHQAAIYRVDRSGVQATVTPATETRQMVYPLGMVRASDGTLYVCDSGLPDIRNGFHARVWRSLPLAFTVAVHFPGGSQPSQEQLRNKFLQSIRDVIDSERPVQSLWVLQPDSL